MPAAGRGRGGDERRPLAEPPLELRAGRPRSSPAKCPTSRGRRASSTALCARRRRRPGRPRRSPRRRRSATSATSARSRGLERAQLRVVVDPLPLPALAAQAGGVDQQERAAVVLEHACRSRRASCPGTSETIVRSAPSSALKSDDLPTFGRPRIATRIASSPTSRAAGRLALEQLDDLVEQVAGAVPCSAESGNGSPRPSRWNSSASDSCEGSSILFASTSTGLCAARRIVASSSSPGRDAGARVDEEEHEVGLGDRGARLLDDRARDRVLAATSTPPVSMSRNRLPAHSQTSSLRSRVVPCRLVHDRRARRGQPVDERRLADVREADDRDRPDQRRLAARRAGLGSCPVIARSATSPRGRPRACTLGEPVEEHADPALDLGGRLLVAAAALRAAPRAGTARPTAIEQGLKLPSRQNCVP